MGFDRPGAILGAVLAALAFLLVAGCVTSPYQSAFSVCDDEAGACYQYCEQFAGDPESYGACHADCEVDASRCFADAYDPYAYSSTSAYASSGYSSWPWYGRYGRWAPRQGYYFDFTYFERYPRYNRGYPDYHYRDRRWRDRHGDRDRRRHRDGDRGGRRRGDNDGDRSGRPPRNSGGGNNATPPPRATPPSPPPRTTPPSPPPRAATPPPRRPKPRACTKCNTRSGARQDDIKTDPE